MVWSGFRPSDEANAFGYSLPSNMYAAGALERALHLNRAVWRSEEFAAAASKLLADIAAGGLLQGLPQRQHSKASVFPLASPDRSLPFPQCHESHCAIRRAENPRGSRYACS